MRYFFHVYHGNGGSFEYDRSGIEVADVSAAWSHAYWVIREFIRQTPVVSPYAHLYMAEASGDGYLIPFSMALHKCAPGDRPPNSFKHPISGLTDEAA